MEINIHEEDSEVIEKPWHPGEMALERVISNTINRGGMILPP